MNKSITGWEAFEIWARKVPGRSCVIMMTRDKKQPFWAQIEDPAPSRFGFEQSDGWGNSPGEALANAMNAVMGKQG